MKVFLCNGHGMICYGGKQGDAALSRSPICWLNAVGGGVVGGRHGRRIEGRRDVRICRSLLYFNAFAARLHFTFQMEMETMCTEK
jgi:hypothetical protein